MEDATCVPTDPETSVWDSYCPVVETEQGPFIYLTGDIEEPAAYNEVVHRLYLASEEETFTIIINNGGGAVHSAIAIADAIRCSAATVNARVTGFAASGATIIALAVDNLDIAPHSSFMLHNYSLSGGGSSKGAELRSRQAFMDMSLRAAFEDFYGGFLTPKEMEEVVEDKDFWFTPEEVLARWELRKQYLKDN